MGKFFIKADDLFRITFPDGEWVDVKRELTQADRDYIMNKMVNAKASKDSPEISVTLGNLPLLERSIVAWSFTDDGKPAEVNTDNISCLSSKYRDIVLKEVDRLSKEVTGFLAG